MKYVIYNFNHENVHIVQTKFSVYTKNTNDLLTFRVLFKFRNVYENKLMK